MTHTYATYKRPPSEQKTYTDWKWRAGYKYSKQTDWEKKAGAAKLISDKNRLQKKSHKKKVTSESHPESHHIILKGRIYQEHKHCKYISTQHRSTQIHKENLGGFKKDIDSNTIIIGDFNTPLSKMDKSSKHNINKDIVALNNALDEMDLTDIYI